MHRRPLSYILLAALFSVFCNSAGAKDYVRLRNGHLIECAILRQDTSVVYITYWEDRFERQPPLQVYTREEIESIWFDQRPVDSAPALPYLPRVRSVEFGGSFSFQSWATTHEVRRHMIQLTTRLGTAIVRQLGLETEAEFTIPMGGRSDPEWSRYPYGHQLVINAVVQPFSVFGCVPFAVLGGGVARDIPVGEVILSTSPNNGSTLDFGTGVKWGRGHIGCRVEWRTYLYTWTNPDAPLGEQPRSEGDATQFKVGFFGYF